MKYLKKFESHNKYNVGDYVKIWNINDSIYRVNSFYISIAQFYHYNISDIDTGDKRWKSQDELLPVTTDELKIHLANREGKKYNL